MAKLTPMMQQYHEIKEKYPDSILFFRMGDFYEMFEDDAKLAAKRLDIALTSRNKGSGEKTPMAGVPAHSAESYIAELIDQDFSVAICEQLEDPSEASGLVKRDVIRVITPGTIIENEILDSSENNFLTKSSLFSKYLYLSFLSILPSKITSLGLVRSISSQALSTLLPLISVMKKSPVEIST